jgi:hypothetical protein
MTTSRAIVQGLSLARRSGRAVWVLFFANLGLAAVTALPVYHGILKFTGHSLMSQTLARGFSVDWMTDFVTTNPGWHRTFSALILVAALLAMVVQSVLAGGVLAGFERPGTQRSLGDFFHDCGRHGWRMIRLLIVALIFYWIVFRLFNHGLVGFVDSHTEHRLDDRSVFWARLIPYALVLLGLGFVNLIVDYARVRLVMEDGNSAIEAFLASLGYSLRRLGKVLIVYTVPSLAGLAVLGVYAGVVALPVTRSALAHFALSPARQSVALAVLFTVQQATVWGRYWFRVATWSSEWSYYAGGRLL